MSKKLPSYKPILVGSPSRADSLYIKTVEDQALRLIQQGHVQIRAPRQSGKTSLANFILRSAKEKGLVVASLDFLQCAGLETDLLVWLEYLLSSAQKQLGIDWKSEGLLDQSNMFESFFLAIPLEYQCIILLDECDLLQKFTLPERGSFLLNLKSLLSKPQFSHIHLATFSLFDMAKLAEDFDARGTGFNLGETLHLPGFDLSDSEIFEQIHSQAFPFLPKHKFNEICQTINPYAGGQRFIVASLLCHLQHQLQKTDSNIQGVLSKTLSKYLSDDTSPLSNHYQLFDSAFVHGDYGLQALGLFEQISTSQEDRVQISSTEYHGKKLLLDVGLIRQVGQNSFSVRNLFYKQHFAAEWIAGMRHKLSSDIERSNYGATKKTGKHLLVLACGGTMGMVLEGDKTQFRKEVVKKLLDEYVSPFANCSFEQVEEKDGINISIGDWLELADIIQSAYANYDGFVITHGTDTLAYTASALAYALGSSLDKPVVLTGSQTTGDIIHGDMAANLSRACFVAADAHAPKEVMICFHDKLFRALKAEKFDDRLFDGFHSPGLPPLAQITEKLLYSSSELNAHFPKVLEPLCQDGQGKLAASYLPYFASNILMLNLVPGIRASHYLHLLDHFQDIEGLFITTAGAGNISSEKPSDILAVIAQASRLNIPSMVSSTVPINPFTAEQYERSIAASEEGAIPSGNMTLSAAYTKFSWAIACAAKLAKMQKLSHEQNLSIIKSVMQSDYLGEMQLG